MSLVQQREINNDGYEYSYIHNRNDIERYNDNMDTVTLIMIVPRIPQVYGAPVCCWRSFIHCWVVGTWTRLRGGRPCVGNVTSVGPLLSRN